MDDQYISEYDKDFTNHYHRNKKEFERALAALRAAPDPKVIYVDGPGEGNHYSSLHFQVAVKFDTSTLNKDRTSYGKFEPKNHSFTIYRWNPKAKIEPSRDTKWDNKNAVHIPTKLYYYPDGAYYAWLEHKRSKPRAWIKCVNGYTNSDVEITLPTHYGQKDRLVEAHLFFKTEEDFKNWVGDENYASMFTDLLN